MSGVSSLCFCVCLGVLASAFLRGADLLSPGRLFGFLWFLAIGLANLKLSAFQYEWSIQDWLLLSIGVGSFILGTYMVSVVWMGEPILSAADMRRRIASVTIDERVLFRLTMVVFLCYVVSYLASYLIKGFIPLLTPRPSEMRTKFTVFAFGLIVHAAPAIMFFVLQYFVLVKGRRMKKGILGMVFLITAGTYFFLLQRFDYAIWAVISFVFLYYGSGYLRLRTLLIPVLAFAGLFYWIQSLRLIGHIEHYIYYASRMKIDIGFAVITEPYMYVVMNLENFVHGSKLLDQFGFGYYTFNFLMSLTGLKHWLAEYFSMPENPYMTGGYNTYSFLWAYYRDFGVLGIGLLPLVLGAAISTVYHSMRTRPTILNISLYGLAVFVILISFFHNALAMLQFVFIVILIYLVNASVLRHSAMVNERTSEGGREGMLESR